MWDWACEVLGVSLETLGKPKVGIVMLRLGLEA